MDQTAPAHQILLRNVGKRSEDSGMDAVSVYVLVAIIKKRLKLETSLYTILQILSVTLFERMALFQALTDCENTMPEGNMHNQLNLFDLTSGQ